MMDVIFFLVLGIFTALAAVILLHEFYKETTAEKRIRSLKPLSNGRRNRG